MGAFHEVAKQLAQHSRLTRGLSTALFLLGAAAVVVGGIATLVLGLNPAVFSASAVFGSYAMWMGHRLSRLSFDLTDGHTAKLLAQEALRRRRLPTTAPSSNWSRSKGRRPRQARTGCAHHGRGHQEPAGSTGARQTTTGATGAADRPRRRAIALPCRPLVVETFLAARRRLGHSLAPC